MAIKIYSDAKQVILSEGQKLITTKQNNPIRRYAIAVQNTAWKNVRSTAPEQYREILAAVLETTAKGILLDYVKAFTLTPAEITEEWFTEEYLLDRALGSNSEWLSKEELEKGWLASATRNKIIENNPAYKENTNYRKTANAFAEMVLKLSGKTTILETKYIDWILTKLEETDLDTEFGAFVVKRLESMKNKPVKTDIDLDIL